jgi:hypothetical protein
MKALTATDAIRAPDKPEAPARTSLALTSAIDRGFLFDYATMAIVGLKDVVGSVDVNSLAVGPAARSWTATKIAAMLDVRRLVAFGLLGEGGLKDVPPAPKEHGSRARP